MAGWMALMSALPLKVFIWGGVLNVKFCPHYRLAISANHQSLQAAVRAPTMEKPVALILRRWRNLLVYVRIELSGGDDGNWGLSAGDVDQRLADGVR